jgi:TPR repeat protein
MKFNKISRFFWGFRRFLSLQHYIRSKVILAAIIVVLPVVVLVLSNVGIKATPAVVPPVSAVVPPVPAVSAKMSKQRFDEAMVLYNQKKYAAAVPILLETADHGYASAQYYLGVLYDNGRGVPQDYVKAEEWYRKAAVQGNASAQYYLGVLYDNGHGVPKDPEKAVEWYRKAADQGNADAKKKLGVR